MQWLNDIVDEAVKRWPEGEIIVSSGVSPSGTYHLGTLREVLTAEIIAVELERRGRKARHLHIVDDLDVFRKVPVNVSSDFEKYLGKPLYDVPAPDGSSQSYADFYLADLLRAAKKLRLKMEAVRAHQKYREGFFTAAIEKTVDNAESVKQILESVSGHKTGSDWSPIQVLEEGYLKNREFVSINRSDRTVIYKDNKGQERAARYDKGEVKLNWRIDWPARWWLLKVNVEPFGRDHATKGGSYDTGKEIAKRVFDTEAPLPVPYNFINRVGETKKMSKSDGNVITASELLNILPPEIIWFFILRYPPGKQLFFDEGQTLLRLFDEFAELLAKPDKSGQVKQLVELCLNGVEQPTVSNVPFSHLVASYQASLKDPEKTLEVIKRTEHAAAAETDAATIKKELEFINNWLSKSAPEDVKFELLGSVKPDEFSDAEKAFLKSLADKIESAPADADGSWFHQAIYDLKDSAGLQPQERFSVLYRVLIGKNSGPRAGWFLSILPRTWLLKRLKLEA